MRDSSADVCAGGADDVAVLESAAWSDDSIWGLSFVERRKVAVQQHFMAAQNQDRSLDPLDCNRSDVFHDSFLSPESKPDPGECYFWRIDLQNRPKVQLLGQTI
jgi:hypothetical protein